MIQNQHISKKDNRITCIDNPTAINLIINDEKYPAYLNGSKAAQGLLSKLPYTVSVSQGMHDYCGVMEHLDYNEDDVQDGWFNGDIAFDVSGDWFVIFLCGENNNSQYHEVNLGQLANQSDIKKIASLPATINITIELAKLLKQQ